MPARKAHAPSCRASRRQRAFSLLEMSVALTITGLLLVGVWKILPALREEVSQPPEQLALADEAIVGYLWKNHRLPCPAKPAGDGKEASASGLCQYPVGEFPFHTLGVHLAARLRYGVYQDGASSLTRASSRHTPELPPVPADPSATEWPLPVAGSGEGSTLNQVALRRDTAGFSDTANRINGLDFCAALREVLDAPSPLLQSGGIIVAYALAHPGAGDADDDGSLFDGLNKVERNFAQPGAPLTDDYDDYVLAAGLPELAGRLACPTYLSRANAAAHTARAAYDNFRLALAMLQFFAFDLDVASFDVQQAYTGLANASLGVLSSTLSTINSGIAYATANGTVKVLIAAAEAANSSVSLGTSIYKLVQAVDKVDADKEGNVNEKLDKAKKKRVDAEANAHMLLMLANETARRAVALDTKGLTP
jgi:prepilin-type N-terminal cleavage/methylation domain-containing protein